LKARKSLRRILKAFGKAKSTTDRQEESTPSLVRKEVTETLTTIVLRDPRITTDLTEEDTLVRGDLDLEAGLLKGITEHIDENQMYVIFQFFRHFSYLIKINSPNILGQNLNTLFF